MWESLEQLVVTLSREGRARSKTLEDMHTMKLTDSLPISASFLLRSLFRKTGSVRESISSISCEHNLLLVIKWRVMHSRALGLIMFNTKASTKDF